MMSPPEQSSSDELRRPPDREKESLLGTGGSLCRGIAPQLRTFRELDIFQDGEILVKQSEQSSN